MSKGVELLLLQLLSVYYKSNKPVGPENSKENSSKAVEAMNSPNGKLYLLPAIQHWILSPTLIFSVKSKNIKVNGWISLQVQNLHFNPFSHQKVPNGWNFFLVNTYGWNLEPFLFRV